MSGTKRQRRAPSRTPWDEVPEERLGPAQIAVRESSDEAYAARHAPRDDSRFFNSYVRESCPQCGGGVAKDGFTPAGLQRYRCKSCGLRFSAATGTMFEDGKLSVSDWSHFIGQLLAFESVSAATWEDMRADTTNPYWAQKLFRVLAGVQDDVVLSGSVFIDETYLPVASKDARRNADGTLPRGLSRNQMCVGVGVDESGASLLRFEGYGKTNRSKTWDAFGSHVAPGSKLVGDLEKAHLALVDGLSLSHEAYNSKLLKRLPDGENPLNPVNRLCFLLKRFLSAHKGFDRGDLQGWLDLFWVTVNPPEDRLEKIAFVLDRAMHCPVTLRYRDFYNVKPR